MKEEDMEEILANKLNDLWSIIQASLDGLTVRESLILCDGLKTDLESNVRFLNALYQKGYGDIVLKDDGFEIIAVDECDCECGPECEGLMPDDISNPSVGEK